MTKKIRSCQTVIMKKMQKEPFVGVPEHSCSKKFLKIHNKASLTKSLLRHRCFHVNFETLLRILFREYLRATLWRDERKYVIVVFEWTETYFVYRIY